MKAALLAAGILLGMCGAAPAGDVHIPDASIGQGSSVSIPWAQAEIRYQALVPAALLGGKRIRISNLAFAPVTSGTFSATQLEIRMAHTMQSLSLVFDNNLQKDRTVVFSGPASWNFTASQWSDLGLTSVFHYNGSDSLVVEVRFVGGQGGASFWAGVIQTYFASGAGTYSAPQGGNILLKVSPKMRLRYDEALIVGSGSTSPGGVVTFSLSSPSDAGLAYQVGTSLGVGPIPIDSRQLNLSPDSLLVASVGGSSPAVFADYAGWLDGSGSATARLSIPNLGVLKGLRLHTAFLTLLASAPSGVKNLSGTYTFTVQ
ncbi:MAG: hypothetical protein JXQ29_08335 [Planctomycetes bacterium]|nr:hypothetical protein [Planctomycetota bacterium]